MELNYEIWRVNKEFGELDFFLWIQDNGYEILKTTLANHKKINEFFKGDEPDLDMIGKPDFFIYDSTRYFFCEFKSINDTLSLEQIAWRMIHKRFDCRLALAIKDVNDVKTEEAINDLL